jgi:adenosylcobyric acid synthase
LEWDVLRKRGDADSVIDIAVIRLPRIANLDEFQPLAIEPGVRVRFIGHADDLGAPDLIIIPGTKSTLGDLAWLRERGLAQAIIDARSAGIPVLGICGGFQMLGTHISDSDGVEGHGTAEGLALLPVQTAFASEKVTKRVRARVASSTALWDADGLEDTMLDAYEIHMGRTERTGDDLCTSPFVIGEDADGLSSADGHVVGTYMHGLLENDTLRRAMVRTLAARKGVQLPDGDERDNIDAALNRLAKSVSDNLDMDAIASLIDMNLTSAE